ncbi:MAG: SRPBCC domain-containing protein [Paracoccaceae bacterium]|nr:MAG: SRPBCC domain-containing protein [Paracoccaceae bacterium]
MTTRLTLETRGDTQVIVTRRFAAPPATVFRAHVDPLIMPRWLTGPDGWVMRVCISEPRPGGRIRCEWVDAEGQNGFHLTGEYHEIDEGSRILHVERMHLPDPTPDNRVETLFRPDAGGTLMVMTMTVADAASRAAMLETGMAEGMEASYQRLEGLPGYRDA